MDKFATHEICGYKIDYYFVTEDEMEDIYGSICAGLFIAPRQAIYICTDQHPQQIEATIRHENLEAINHYYHIQLNHDQIIQLEGVLQIWDKINYTFKKEKKKK